MSGRVIKRILLAIPVALVLIALTAGGFLWQAHRAIDRERAALPTADELARFASGPTDDLPVRLSWIETASQKMPRSAVLDPGKDPAPDAPYVMSHPAFVLEWADGRILLIDTGMRRESALSFGKPMESLGGAGPISALTPTAEALGAAASRVRAIVFTHLHTDHVDGVVALCAAAPQSQITAFMTVAQAERPNYTTRPGLALLDEATCVKRKLLDEGTSLRALPGFPGVAVIDAGGHTPGSEIILVRVASDGGVKPYAFAGDTVNHLDGVHRDIAKPWLYRTFLVPESDERQSELRHFLAALERERGFAILVSHDEASIVATGVPPWSVGG